MVAAASVDAPADRLDVARDITFRMVYAIHAWAVRVALLVTEIAQKHWFASESAQPFLGNKAMKTTQLRKLRERGFGARRIW